MIEICIPNKKKLQIDVEEARRRVSFTNGRYYYNPSPAYKKMLNKLYHRKVLIPATILLISLFSSCRTTRINSPAFKSIAYTSYKIGYLQGVKNTFQAIIDTTMDLNKLGKMSFQDFKYSTDSILNSRQ